MTLSRRKRLYDAPMVRENAPLSRFLPGSIADRFETVSHARGVGADDDPASGGAVRVDVAARLREMW